MEFGTYPTAGWGELLAHVPLCVLLVVVPTNMIVYYNTAFTLFQFGCCLSSSGFNVPSACNVSDCAVETGGSPAHLATPTTLLVMASVAVLSQLVVL